MARVWTDKQKAAFGAEGGTILVSAAAGSGKTAVLIERIMRKITDPVHPVDVDRMLVVTFTRAAAAEMCERLSKALSARAAAQPDDKLYQRQLMLLPQAHISTVHGFCTALLREHAAEAGLPLRFSVADDTQADLIAAEAMDEVLEESFRQRDPSFLALAAQLGGGSGRDDSGLRSAVENAYTFMQAQPFPEQWLRARQDEYSAVIPLEKTVFMNYVRRELLFILDEAIRLNDKVFALTEDERLAAYRTAVLIDRHRLDEARAAADDEKLSYDALQAAVCGLSLERLAAIRKKDAAAQEMIEEVKGLRASIKKQLSRAAGLFCGTEEECREDLVRLTPLVEALGTLAMRFSAVFTAKKRERKLLDYNDLEHEALRLLLTPENRPTQLAHDLSQRFDEIMVDEFQDTNAAQSTLFEALSKNGKNLFFVGDVKQSIYAFRQAKPEIFTAFRDAYAPYDPKDPRFPALITLENNFRSRLEVTDTVNFLFRQLMHRDLGGVEYDKGEALVCSAQYPPAGDRESEWLLLDMAGGDGEADPVAAEARLIGRRILELTDTMTVGDGEGTRPLAFGDICILMRSRKAYGRIVQELEAMGIPTATDGSGKLLETPEVATVLSLLRAIDDPLRDVELLSVMLSPLYGFSPDDAAAVRLHAPKTALWPALTAYAADGENAPLRQRCAALLDDLRRARALSVSLPADRLLERLYREMSIPAILSARSGGRQRLADLQKLDQFVRGYAPGEYRGLSAFVRYVDRMQERGGDLPAGEILRADAVQLMSVHGSKGLEFPVVFLARLSAQINNEDARQLLLFHERCGIGLRLRDDRPGMQEKHRTLPFVGTLAARRQDARAEELRIWYVAMTRAREKLILVDTEKDLDKKLAALAQRLPMGQALSADTVLHAASPGDLFLLASLRHPSFAGLWHADGVQTLKANSPLRVIRATPAAANAVCEQERHPVPQADPAAVAALRERFAYRYGRAALSRVPAKIAASALSHRALARERIASVRPAFLQSGGLSPTERGTAMHTFMQFADLSRAATDPAAEARRLTENGFLTAQQCDSLSVDRLARFFSSALYARMAASPDCRRELAFTALIPAASVAQEPLPDGDETVVVQGIADCVFREGDGLVLLDYKTDRVDSPEELADRYRSQMLLYRQALEPILCLPVREMLLYSFALGTVVPVKPENVGG